MSRLQNWRWLVHQSACAADQCTFECPIGHGIWKQLAPDFFERVRRTVR